MVIGIIGNGILGTVQKEWLLKETEHEVLTYDIDAAKRNSTLQSMAQNARFFILCLPSDSGKNGRLDTSILEMTIDQLRELDDREGVKTIIIRSTVPVGFTRAMANKYQEFQFYFMPEFLTEKTAKEDFEESDKFIIGVSDIHGNAEQAEALYSLGFFPLHGKVDVVEFETAELTKLATNSFYAIKIIFANELHNLCTKFEIPYEAIKGILAENPRIGSSVSDNQGRDVHLRIAQDGTAGFGGKCLKKDLSELSKMMEKDNVGFGLLSKVLEINNKIRK